MDDASDNGHGDVDKVAPLKIIWHIGAPKTGSTALQYSFITQRDDLNEHSGLSYWCPPADMERLVVGNALGRLPLYSGNANDLFDVMMDGESVAQNLDDAIHRVLFPHFAAITSETQAVLLSSENMSWLNAEQLRLMLAISGSHVAAMTGRTIEHHIILFVRDMLGHCLSFWAHDARRFGYAGDALQYARTKYRLVQFESIDALMRLGDIAKKSILPYQESSQMLAALLDAAGLAPIPVHRNISVQANTGLGLSELNLIRAAAAGMPAGSWLMTRYGWLGSNEWLWSLSDQLERSSAFQNPGAIGLTPDEAVGLLSVLLDRQPDATLVGEEFVAYRGVTIPVGRRGHDADDGVSDQRDDGWRHIIADRLPSYPPEQQRRIDQFAFFKRSGLFDAAHYRTELQSRNLPWLGDRDDDEVLLSHYLQFGMALDLAPSKKFDPRWYRARYPNISSLDAAEHYLHHGHIAGFVPTADDGYPQHFRHPIWTTGPHSSEAYVTEAEAHDYCWAFANHVHGNEWTRSRAMWPGMQAALFATVDPYIQIQGMFALAMYSINARQDTALAANQFRETWAQAATHVALSCSALSQHIYWNARFHEGYALARSGCLALAEQIASQLRIAVHDRWGTPPEWVLARLHELG